MEWAEQAQRELGVRFADTNLLRQALTHRSYIFEKGLPEIESNEKLEYLGDTVLGFIITNLICHRFPTMLEGELSKLRARLVNTAMLADIAREIKLGDWLVLGHGEEHSGGRDKTSILGNSFEALIGAMFLDQGLETARVFVNRQFEQIVEIESGREASQDFKTRLQELTAKKFGLAPVYRILKATGPDHQKVFTAEVAVGKHTYGRGQGRAKKEAEQVAAKEALGILEST